MTLAFEFADRSAATKGVYFLACSGGGDFPQPGCHWNVGRQGQGPDTNDHQWHVLRCLDPVWHYAPPGVGDSRGRDRRSTLQADALKLVARKLQSSLAVEGVLPEDGLAAFGDEGDDLMMALARKIVSGEAEETETAIGEEVFTQARDAVTEDEEQLVDVDWRPVEVNGNGHNTNGNGHHDALGPTVELVAVNGRNGNGHHEDADEPQKSLLTWAELIAAELPKPKARRRKPQPASMSIFEWAFEQEREAKALAAVQ